MDIVMPLTTIHHNNNRGLPIPPILQLLTTLRFYASSNFQVGTNFKSQSVVCKISFVNLNFRL